MSSATPHRLRRPRSIFATIFVLMTLSVTILFVGFAAFHLVHAGSVQEADHRQYLSTTLQFIRAELEEGLLDSDAEAVEIDEIEEVVLRENAARRFGSLFVEISDEEGDILLRSTGLLNLLDQDPPFPPPASSPGDTTIEYWEGTDENHYVLSSLLTSAPDGRYRLVRIALDWSKTEDRVEAFRQKSIGAVLVCTLLAAIAAAFVTRHALRPLSMITDAAEHLRSGSFDARLVPEHLPVEMNALAESFARMQEHLRESFERLSQFSAELAHELRTPVNNLMGETEVALSQPRTSDEYREVLISTLEESTRLSRMIDSLLFLARASRGTESIETEDLDVLQEVTDVIEYFHPLCDERGVATVVNGEATLAADRTLFRRALSNVLSNALEASAPGGTISVSITSRSGVVAIAVTDDGVGIAEDELPTVFERFRRSKSARSRRPEGIGLGLSIVRSIVHLHRGTATIESNLDQGTTVTLVFPK